MVASSVLGFPRIGVFRQRMSILTLISFCSGPNREIKKVVEAYWAGKTNAEEVTKVAAEVKKLNWTELQQRGVTYIPRCDNRVVYYRYLIIFQIFQR